MKVNSFKLCKNILFYYITEGRRKLAWTFCLLVSLTLFFRRVYKTLQSIILNNIENQKYMENLKISFLAYCLFSEFLILEDYMLTIWGEVIFLCLMKTKIMPITYFQKIQMTWWKANTSVWWILLTVQKWKRNSWI